MADPPADAPRAERDDGALLAASRGGDERAFLTLARRHHPALRAVARCWPGEHERWPGEWCEPPHPWGSIAARRLGQRDIPRLLARCVHELGVARGAAVTLCDVHGWPVSECALALGRADADVRALLAVGRESLRAALEAEIA